LAVGIGIFTFWVCNAVLHSVIITGFSNGIFSPLYSSGDIGTDGTTTGLFLMGTIVNFCTMLTVNLKISLETMYWTVYNVIAVLGSVAIWVGFVIVYSRQIVFSADFFGVGKQLFSRPIFYLAAVFIPITAVLCDFIYKHIREQYFPSPIDVIRERQIMVDKENKGLTTTVEDYDFERIHGVANRENKSVLDLRIAAQEVGDEALLGKMGVGLGRVWIGRTYYIFAR